MTQNDNRKNLFDLHDIVASLEMALEALRKDMEGRGPEHREQFAFQIGYAIGRLGRVQASIDPAKEPPSFVCPRCGAKSFNPNDIAQHYCGRCHQFVEEDPHAP